jgi:hypothetical protein
MTLVATIVSSSLARNSTVIPSDHFRTGNDWQVAAHSTVAE